MQNIKIDSIKNYLTPLILTVLIGIGISSCEDEDKNNFDSLSKSGAFVRFEEPFPTVVDVSSLDQIPNVAITAIIENPNNTVANYSISVGATISGVTIDQAPLISDLTSFPVTVNLTMTDIANALGLDTADIGFGDTFDFVGTATNNQGTVYTAERQSFDRDTKVVTGGNNSADLIDELGYRNAFEFGFAIPCPPETGNIAGDWILDMQDLYGDGWDNAFVTVDIDGTTTQYTIAAGSAATHIVNVPAGTARLVISYTAGAFEEEHVYTVQKPDGTVLGPFGPNPGLCIN
jgi:hypothetical protein